MDVFHLKRALADQLREADFWYDQSPELRQEFINELDDAIEDIKKAPNGYVIVSREWNLRRYYEKRFHTAILFQYLENKDLLRIVRVYNCRMNPRKFL